MGEERTKRYQWDRDAALELVNEIWSHAGGVFAIALGGSLLTKSSGANDLDILVYPMHSATSESDVQESVSDALIRCGLKRRASIRAVHRAWEKLGSTDKKSVEVWRTADHRKVDVFYVR
jgi:hypothetical protein